MTLALVQTKPRVRVPAAKKPAATPDALMPPAGARLMEYFGPGAQVAVTAGGMMLATQADHLLETVRLGDVACALSVR